VHLRAKSLVDVPLNNVTLGKTCFLNAIERGLAAFAFAGVDDFTQPPTHTNQIDFAKSKLFSPSDKDALLNSSSSISAINDGTYVAQGIHKSVVIPFSAPSGFVCFLSCICEADKDFALKNLLIISRTTHNASGARLLRKQTRQFIN
jgi:hypothetical protein